MTAGTTEANGPSAPSFRDYLELTKPRLSLLSVLTALTGYAAARPPTDRVKLVCLIVGTALAAGGVASLNQWMERDTDALMKRTAQRPIPAGKVTSGSAFVLGWLMSIAALFLLFATVNPLAALFTLLTIVAYLAWYTPAKRFTRWSTEIGAVAGAFPPLIGWAAAEGHVSALGWILFAVLYFWQIPHFMAIAWTYRRDYAHVKFPMLSVLDQSGAWVAGWSLVNTVALVGVTVLPALLGLASYYYTGAIAVCGLWFVWRAVAFLRAKTRDLAARQLFLASLLYLPLVLGSLVIDRMFVT